MYELSQDLGNMNLDKNTKFPISLYYIFSVIISVKIYPKPFFTRHLHFVNQQKLYIWEFLKNKVITNLKNKSIFQVSILVLINILQYRLISKNRYKSIFKNIKKKTSENNFYKIMWLIFQFRFWKNSNFEIEMIHFQA